MQPSLSKSPVVADATGSYYILLIHITNIPHDIPMVSLLLLVKSHMFGIEHVICIFISIYIYTYLYIYIHIYIYIIYLQLYIYISLNTTSISLENPIPMKHNPTNIFYDSHDLPLLLVTSCYIPHSEFHIPLIFHSSHIHPTFVQFFFMPGA